MLAAILSGSQMGPGDGWFGPAQTRYTWEWLAGCTASTPKKDAVSQGRLPRVAGAVRPARPRTSDGTHHRPTTSTGPTAARTSSRPTCSTRLFRRHRRQSGDGKLTQGRLGKLLRQARRRQGPLDARRPARDCSSPRLSAGVRPRATRPTRAGAGPRAVRRRDRVVQRGPEGRPAGPELHLKTADGKETRQLSKLIGTKPVVLVFGNFTCGPFRVACPGRGEAAPAVQGPGRRS